MIPAIAQEYTTNFLARAAEFTKLRDTLEVAVQNPNDTATLAQQVCIAETTIDGFKRELKAYNAYIVVIMN